MTIESRVRQFTRRALMTDFERGVLDDLALLNKRTEALETQEFLQPGTGGALVPVGDVLLTGSGSTLDIATSIAATGAHILIIYSVQTSGGLDGTGVRMHMQFNGNSSSVYHYYNRLEFNSQQNLQGFADIAGATFIDVGRVSGRDTVSPNVVLHRAAGFILIPDYANTTLWKTVVFGDFLRTTKRDSPSASDPDLTGINGGGGWENTAAITSIKMITSSDTFGVDSRWTTYLMNGLPGGTTSP